MKKLYYLLSLAVVILMVSACSENPVADDHGDLDEPLSVELSISEDHVTTLSETVFTASARDHHGNMFKDFEHMRFEYRLEGESEWREAEMSQQGDNFEARFMFMSSGEYAVRIGGRRHGAHEDEVFFNRQEPLHVERAHAEIGSYRVEYENFPGHVHEGGMATLTFWIFESDGDDHAEGHAVENLVAEIHCTDPDGTEEHHEAEGHEGGEYHAEHTFSGAGEAHLALHFTDSDGMPFEVDFHLPVADEH